MHIPKKIFNQKIIDKSMISKEHCPGFKTKFRFQKNAEGHLFWDASIIALSYLLNFMI